MKTICHPFCRNSCISAHDVRLYILVPMNQILPNKLSKEHNLSAHKRPTTQIMLKYLKKQDGYNINMQSWKQCALLIIITMALW